MKLKKNETLIRVSVGSKPYDCERPALSNSRHGTWLNFERQLSDSKLNVWENLRRKHFVHITNNEHAA